MPKTQRIDPLYFLYHGPSFFQLLFRQNPNGLIHSICVYCCRTLFQLLCCRNPKILFHSIDCCIICPGIWSALFQHSFCRNPKILIHYISYHERSFFFFSSLVSPQPQRINSLYLCVYYCRALFPLSCYRNPKGLLHSIFRVYYCRTPFSTSVFPESQRINSLCTMVELFFNICFARIRGFRQKTNIEKKMDDLVKKKKSELIIFAKEGDDRIVGLMIAFHFDFSSYRAPHAKSLGNTTTLLYYCTHLDRCYCCTQGCEPK